MPAATDQAQINAIAKEGDKKTLAERVFKMAKKDASREKRTAKALAEGKRIGSNTVMAATAGGVAFGSGWVFAKYPEAARIADRVDTRAVAGAVATATGVWLAGKSGQDGQLGNFALAAGLGWLLPWADAKGAEVANR